MPGFELYTDDRSLYVRLPFGPTGPRIVGGGPVLNRIVRMRRKSITEWSNDEPLSIQIDYLLSDWEHRQGAEFERMIRTIEKMAGLDARDPEPQELIVRGNPPGCVPHDVTNSTRRRWWIEDHTEGDEVYRNQIGNRIHVGGTITLTEVVEDRTLDRLPRKKKRPRMARTFCIAKKGDTLITIAKRFKVKGGWRTLAKLNKKRDPKNVKQGEHIRLT